MIRYTKYMFCMVFSRKLLFSAGLVALLAAPLPAAALDARALVERATELIEQEQYNLARTYLAPALIDPYLTRGERSRAYYFRGYTFNVQDMPVSAVRDYNRALEFNPANAVALVALGVAHSLGRGVEADLTVGFRYYEQAAALDYAPAHFHVGRALLFGRGVEKNVPLARRSLEKAAAADHLFAMNHMAASFRSHHVAEPEPRIAEAWYRKAHAAGSTQALMYMGFMHANGELGEVDNRRAAKLYQQALDEGLEDAGVNLAHAYLTGTGVEQSDSRAFDLYQRAGLAGVAGSFVGLGHMYEFGLGTAPNADRARQWYERGALQGQQNATMRLVAYYLKQPDAASRAQALRWSKVAAESGDAQAQNDYAWLLATSKYDELRNGTLALDAAHKAVAKNSSASYLDTLAAAYAELGNFERAVATQQQAIAAISGEELDIKSELELRLEQYRRSQPWRE